MKDKNLNNAKFMEKRANISILLKYLTYEFHI